MTSDESTKNIRDKIWLTAKTRMIAEARLNRLDLISHLFITASSAMIIIITLFADYFSTNAPVQAYTIAYSVIVFGASIVLFGFNFGRTATLHRECYLKLKKLEHSSAPDIEIANEYHQILAGYPNHSDADWLTLIIEQKLFGNNDLKDSSKRDIKLTFWHIITYFSKFIMKYVLPILILLGSFYSLTLF